jgi:PAS domain S-box-containing protein
MTASTKEPGSETASTQAVVVADREGVIRKWNDAAERVFGYSAAEAIGQTIDLLMPEEERADHWRNYRRVMTTNIMNYTPDHILDVEGVRRNGCCVALDAMLEAGRDPTGRITEITATMREETETPSSG